MSEKFEGIQNPEQMKPTSFADLENKENVTAEELKETLRDYAYGAAINAGVVNSIIDRTELSPEDLQELRQSAQRGAEIQRGHRFPSEEKEYKKVIVHIDSKK